MKKTVRFAGAQLACTPYVQANVLEIRKAIDWAADNNVDYLVTPEAALSGYTANFSSKFNRIKDALTEIEQYAASKQVGLCLGTIWDEQEHQGIVRRNQIRFYSKTGIFLGAINKHYTIEYDCGIGVKSDPRKWLIPLPAYDKIIPIGAVICVDMYGVDGEPGIPWMLHRMGAKVIIHCTNGTRNRPPTNGLSTELSDKISNDWHDVVLRRTSFLTRNPIVTVDNCNMDDGTEYHGNTSSESGVLIDGSWVTSVPRTDTQYFYYDFNLDDISIDDFTKSR